MPTAFKLEVDDGLATLTFDLEGRGANVFNRATLEELAAHVDDLARRDDVRCLVLLSGKPRIFIAGADVEELARVTTRDEAVAAARGGHQVFAAWEALPFPTVAAVNGTCVGGGCELALASDHIVLSDREDIRIGLPEIKIGIIPSWGGCTRLPRRVGLTAALDVILAGKTLRPKKAFRVGLADALVPDASFLDETRRYARRVIDGYRGRKRKRGLAAFLLEGNPLGRALVFRQAKKQVLAKTGGNYPAPLRALETVRTGLARGREAGFEAEAQAIGDLALGSEAASLIHVFRTMQAAKKDPEGAVAPRPVAKVAVLGAGVMGGGIAQLVSDKLDLPVRLKDIGVEPLAGGMAHAAQLFRQQLKRRWITKPQAAEKMALIQPTLDYAGFGGVDLVVEAVVEILDVKRKVFAELEGLVAEDAVLATNTSSISIDLISAELEHPERVVGMHFFNPVDRMPLVEVIRGSKTSDQATQTIVHLSRAMGKTAIVVGDGPGFLVNRLLSFTLAEALWLLDEGHRIEDLDRAVKGWGMPMGPARLTDEVGIDVANKVAHILSDAFPDRLSFPGWFDRLVEEGRLGAKNRKGFYLYEGGKPTKPDPSVYGLLGLEPRIDRPDPARLTDRVVLPMVNEAARCLEEGLVAGPGELDLAMIMGTGFPPFRGGLCRWADRRGPDEILGLMERFADEIDERSRPSEAFRRTAAGGGFYRVF